MDGGKVRLRPWMEGGQASPSNPVSKGVNIHPYSPFGRATISVSPDSPFGWIVS